MVNPKWVNPANITKEKGGGITRVIERLKNAMRFVNSIEHTFHPTNCYASFCASTEQRSYGEVVFKAAEAWTPFAKSSGGPLPPPETWKLLTDDAKGMLTVQAGDRVLALYLQKPNAAGDQTVPSERSACKIKGTLFAHGEKAGPGYEHQASYSDPQVLTSMLYAISQIAKTAKWD